MDVKFKNQQLFVSREQPSFHSNRIFELQTCLKNLTKAESKDSGPKLVDAIINYIDAILDESTNKSIREQIKFCGHLDIIKHCVMPYKETILVKNFIKRIFDILLEEDGNIWYVKRELVKIFLICIRRAPKKVRLKAVDSLPDFYLYKLIDSISSHGDYDFQVVMVELIFCVYGKNTVLCKWKDLIPESQELSQTFSNIRSSTFDEDVRKFLNALNEKSCKIFSIFCHSVFLGNVNCGETFENSNGIWVDFNLSGGAVSWYATTEYFMEDKASPSDPPWTMASFFTSDVDLVQIFRPPNTRNTAIHVKLKAPCISSYDKCGTKVAEAGDVKFFVSKNSGKTTALITRILPSMFRHKFQHNGPPLAQATKKVYKPLNLSIVRQSNLNTSRTKSDVSSFHGPIAAIPAGLCVTSATSPSSNAASEISISDSSRCASIDLVSADQYETAQELQDDGSGVPVQIISARRPKISLPKQPPSEDSDIFETAQGPSNTETDIFETTSLSLCVNLGHYSGKLGSLDLEDGPNTFRRKEIDLEDILQCPDNCETVITLPSSPLTKEDSRSHGSERETAASDLEDNILEHINKVTQNPVEDEISSSRQFNQGGGEEEADSATEQGPTQRPSAGHRNQQSSQLEVDLDNELAARKGKKETERDKNEPSNSAKKPQKKISLYQKNNAVGEKEKKSFIENEPEPSVSDLNGSSGALGKKKQKKVLEKHTTKYPVPNTNKSRKDNNIISSNDSVDLILKENVQIRDKTKKMAAAASQENLPDVEDNTNTRQLRTRAVQVPRRVNKRLNKKKTNKTKALEEKNRSNEQNFKDKEQVVDTFSSTLNGKLQNQDTCHDVVSLSEDNSTKPSNQESLPATVDKPSTLEDDMGVAKQKDQSNSDEIITLSEVTSANPSSQKSLPAPMEESAGLEEENTVVTKENDVGVKKQKHLRKIDKNQNSFDEIILISEDNPPGGSNMDDESAPIESKVLEIDTSAITGKKQKQSRKIHKDQSTFDEIITLSEDASAKPSSQESLMAAVEKKDLPKIHKDRSCFDEIITLSEDASAKPSSQESLLATVEEPAVPEDENYVGVEEQKHSHKIHKSAADESKVLESETSAITGKKQKQSRKIHKDQSTFDEIITLSENASAKPSNQESLMVAVEKKDLPKIHKDRSYFDEIITLSEDASAKPSSQESLLAAVEEPAVPEDENYVRVKEQKHSYKIHKSAAAESKVLESETSAITGKKQKQSRKIYKDQSNFDEIITISEDNLATPSSQERLPANMEKRAVLEEAKTVAIKENDVGGEKQKDSLKIRDNQSNFDEITSICEEKNTPEGSDRKDKPAANESRVLETETTGSPGKKQKKSRKIPRDKRNLDGTTSICKEKNTPEGSDRKDKPAANESRVLETETTGIPGKKQKKCRKIPRDKRNLDGITSICEDSCLGRSNKDNQLAANESGVLEAETAAVTRKSQKPSRKIHNVPSSFDAQTSVCEDNPPGEANKDDVPAVNQSRVFEAEITEKKQKPSQKINKDQSNFGEMTSICEDNLPGGSNKPPASESTVLESRTTEINVREQPNETVDKVEQTEIRYRKRKEYSELMGFLKVSPLQTTNMRRKKARKYNKDKEERHDLSKGSDQEAVPADEVEKGSEDGKCIQNCVVLLRKYEETEELGDNSSKKDEEDLVGPISSEKADAVPKSSKKNNKLLTDERDGFENGLLEASVCEILFDRLKKEENMKAEAANVERDEQISEMGYSQQTAVHTCAMVHQCGTKSQNDVPEILTEANQAKAAQSFNKTDKKLDEITENVQREEEEADNQMMSTTLCSRKRRKLYDPEDLTYLDTITVLEEVTKPEESKRISTLTEDVVRIVTEKKKAKEKPARKKSYGKKAGQGNNKTESKPMKSKKMKILHQDTVLTSFWRENLQAYKKGTNTSLQEPKNFGFGPEAVKKRKPSSHQTRSRITKRPPRKIRATFSRDRIARGDLSSDMSDTSLKLRKTTGVAQEPHFVASDEPLVRKINIISDIRIRPKTAQLGADSGIPRKKPRIDEDSGDFGEDVPIRNITNQEISQWIETGSPNYSQSIIERQVVLRNCNVLLKTLVNQPDDSMEYRDVVAVSHILKKYV